jgi:seryl-tRNA synthetase
MLEIKLFRQNKDLIIEGLKKKNFKQLNLVDEIIKLDEDLRKLKQETETLTSVINTNNTEIGKYIKTDATKVQNLKTHNSILKEKISVLEELLEATTTIIDEKIIQLPNLPHISVETDNGDEKTNGNIVIRENLTTFTKGKPHWEIIKDLNIVNFELGTKITGAGFPVYIGKGAKLQRALIQYFLDYNTNAGYTEYNIPLMVNYDSAYGTGQLPDKEGQMYYAEKDNLYLIPTAEVPLTNIFRDEIVNLPIKMTGHSACFRREAGAYGKEVRGLNRVHQFEKVEIVQLVYPDKSYDVLEEMVLHVENLIKSLELPYRILKLSGTDMSFASALTYDFEVYSAAQDRWLEVSSVSNFETFQSNRMKIRFKEDKKNKLVHTLNGSSLALPRIMACLLENNQTAEGIKIPEALIPYYGEKYLKNGKL